MLAQRWRTGGLVGRSAVEVHGLRRQAQAGQALVLHFAQQATGLDLRRFQRLFDVPDGRYGHAGGVELGHHIGHVVLLRPAFNGGAQRGFVGGAGFVGGVARVVGQLGQAHGLHGGVEQFFVEHGQCKVPIAGLVDAKWRRQRMAVAHAARRLAGEQVARDRGGQEGERGVEHRHVHLLALAGALRLQQRRQGGPGGKQAGHHIAHRFAHQGGRAFGLAGGFHQAAHGLHDDVVSRAVRHGAGLAKAGHAHVDQLGVEAAQFVGTNAQAIGHAGAEVLHHHIGLCGQLVHQGHGLGVLHVEHQALLVAVHHREQGALAVFHGADVAVVVTLRWLDLDDFGTQIGQQRSGQRAGQHTGEIQNLDALQRQAGRAAGGGGWGAHGGSCVAMRPCCGKFASKENTQY